MAWMPKLSASRFGSPGGRAVCRADGLWWFRRKPGVADFGRKRSTLPRAPLCNAYNVYYVKLYAWPKKVAERCPSRRLSGWPNPIEPGQTAYPKDQDFFPSVTGSWVSLAAVFKPHSSQSSPNSSRGWGVLSVPLPQRKSSAGQNFSQPQQMRSGYLGCVGNFFAIEIRL